MAKFADLQRSRNDLISPKLATDIATLDGVAITGVFSDVSEVAFNMIGGSNPVFKCPTAQSGKNAKGKIFIKDGVNYTVAEAKPDNMPGGFTVLALEET